MSVDLKSVNNFLEAQVVSTSDVFDQVMPAASGLLMATIIVAVFWVVYHITTHALKKYIFTRALKHANSKSFLMIWRYVWLFVGSMFTLFALSGSLTALGLSAAFLGMVLGWSLQAPVTGIAAWLMVVIKRPFRIGDRIIIDGIIGDVTDISLTHITLNQVGGTISGEEQSGRGVLIPNGTLFTTKIFNYAFQGAYLLDEVKVLVTYSSDVRKAMNLMIECAKHEIADIMQNTNTEPHTRIAFAESSVNISLRYQTKATSRSTISSAISLRIFDAFNKEKNVNFAFPHMQVVYNKNAD